MLHAGCRANVNAPKKLQQKQSNTEYFITFCRLNNLNGKLDLQISGLTQGQIIATRKGMFCCGAEFLLSADSQMVEKEISMKEV